VAAVGALLLFAASAGAGVVAGAGVPAAGVAGAGVPAAGVGGSASKILEYPVKSNTLFILFDINFIVYIKQKSHNQSYDF
jgi:hypothetical protein